VNRESKDLLEADQILPSLRSLRMTPRDAQCAVRGALFLLPDDGPVSSALLRLIERLVRFAHQRKRRE
jgi:hypothetical protein